MSCSIKDTDRSVVIPEKLIINGYVPFRFRKLRPTTTKIDNRFDGKLFTHQQPIMKNIEELFKDGRTGLLLHFHTGFGKTPFSLFIVATFLMKKCLVLVPTIVLKNQWKQAITTFVSTLSDMIDVACFASESKTLLIEDRSKYDIIILDEIHTYCDATFSKILYRYTPTILLGLTATPRLNFELYDYFFNRTIECHEMRSFLVIPIFLSFKPEERYIYRGRKRMIDYSHLLTTLNCQERLRSIVSYIRLYIEKYNRKAIILTKRIAVIDFLRESLSSLKIDYMHSKKNTYIDDIQILIGTYDKIGLGLNDRSFGMLFILDNIKDVRQAEGRIRQNNFVVIDFVDNHDVFRLHWELRRRWYKERGASVKDSLGRVL